jgi:hypothetical protein
MLWTADADEDEAHDEAGAGSTGTLLDFTFVDDLMVIWLGKLKFSPI